jgi:hypothetical protein
MNVAQSARDPSQLLSAGRSHLGLLVLLAIYLVVTLIYGQLNPLGEAPDEIAHMDLIRFIGTEGHLPRTEAERQAAGYKSDSPMLYHILAGAATAWVNYHELPHLKVNDLSPRHILINDGLSPFAVIHTDDEALPYQGIVLAWHVARLASTIASLGTLVATYAIVLAIRPGDYWLALGAAAVAAAIPQFHFIASAVNDDNLLGLLSALFILALVEAWKDPERRITYVWLGLWFGLALTTKYTVVALFPLVLVVLARAIHRRELSWQMGVGRFLVFGVTAVVTAAWWLIYVEWYFNEIKELGLIAGLTKPLSFDTSTEQVTSFFASGAKTGAGLLPSADATTWDWAIAIFHSFWFVPGEATTAVVTALLLVFLGLCGAAIAGLWWSRQRGDDLPWPIIGVLGLQIVLLLPVPLLRFYLTRNPAEAGQGRHVLFPAAAAVGLLLTWGLATWFPPGYRRFVGLGLAGLLLAVSLLSFFGYLLPAFPPRLPVRTSSDALEGVPNRVNIPFDDTIELVGYEIGEVNQHGALPVALVWHSLDHANQDYLVEISLVDQAGVRSLWLGHPVDGGYPTRAWEPSDVIRDIYWLPLTGLEAGSYRIKLRLLSANETDMLSEPGNELSLADIQLPSLAAQSPLHPLDPSGKELAGFNVWQAGEPMASVPVYRYRAAIPITLSGRGTSNTNYEVSLVGPDGVEQSPKAQDGDLYVFLVDAFWPSGEYKLRVEELGVRTDGEAMLGVEVRPRNFEAPPMSTEVRANFGGDVMLLGYDFPEQRTQPGEALPITLYWQALRPVNHHYIVSNHLLHTTDLRQWGGRDRVPQDYYSTALWTPGEVVRDEYRVPVDPSAPDGVYRLDIGVYGELAGQSWHLPLVKDGTALDANSVTVAPIKVGGPPAGVTVQDPLPKHPQSDNLEGLVTFLGYDMSLEPEALQLTLYWRCDARLPADLTTFVHVRDAVGDTTEQPGIVAQMDRPPADGAYPTSLWDPGEVIRDAIQVPLPSHLPAGDYEVVVGLYDFATGRRLLVLNEQGAPIGDSIRLNENITLQ